MNLLDFKIQKIKYKYGPDPFVNLQNGSKLALDTEGAFTFIVSFSAGQKKVSVWYSCRLLTRVWSIHRCYYAGEMKTLDKIPDLDELLDAVDTLDEQAIAVMFRERQNSVSEQ